MLENKFWSFVNKTDKCWNWVGPIRGLNYGGLTLGKQRLYAHRFSYELHKGKIPNGKIILHSCDNTLCVNPAHLSIGTNKDNSQDMAHKNRSTHGEKHKLAKLNWEQVAKIYIDPRPQSQIARDYGVSQSQICRVKNRLNWTH